jgi:hypothetical protein
MVFRMAQAGDAINMIFFGEDNTINAIPNQRKTDPAPFIVSLAGIFAHPSQVPFQIDGSFQRYTMLGDIAAVFVGIEFNIHQVNLDSP